MTICLVSQEYPPETDFGGIATYTYYLSKGLIKYGANVFVISRSYKKNSYSIYNGVKVIRICENNELLYRKKLAKVIEKLHRKVHIDIIESPEWQADLIEYYKTYKDELKIPVVIKLHTPFFVWKKYNQYTFSPVSEMVEIWEKTIVCNADGIISCSNSLKEIVSKEYNISCSEIETIPNMIEIKDFVCNLKHPQKDRSILYIGSLEERKGVLVLAEAYKKIKEIIPSASIYFIGRDTNRNHKGISTQKYIGHILKECSNVHFIPHIPNDKVFEYMVKANVVVFPSLYENFPYVVLEAMNCGCAIVGSQNGGMKEIIEENVSGLLYNPPFVHSLSDNIIKVLLNDRLADDLGKNATQHIRKFSTQNIIKKQIDYYKRIIDSKL